MEVTQSRVRLTISLSKELAQQIDGLVDGVKIRNRSHAIESLVNESLELLHVKQAVILAGGAQALERVPVFKKMLRFLKQQGISDIIMAVGYLGEQIKE